MQHTDENLFLGRCILERNLVSREAFLECLFQIAITRRSDTSGIPPHSLRSALISSGLMSEGDLRRILAERAVTQLPQEQDEGHLAQALLGARVVSSEELERCHKLQKERAALGESSSDLSDILMEQGLLTREELSGILSKHAKALYICPGCGLRVSAVCLGRGKRYRCLKCNGILRLESSSSDAKTATLPMREVDRSEDEQFEIDRAVALYLKQNHVVRRDQLRQARRLQVEFFRYGLVVPILEILRRLEVLTWQATEKLRRIDFGRVVREPGWKDQAIPGYRLIERIASGGFAALWTAKGVFSAGRRAVKILHPERATDPRSVLRFKREAQLLMQLDSPYIVNGIEYGIEEGCHFLVMEFVEGRSLGQFISENGALPPGEGLKIAKQVALALQYLHREGYLHRDIKPDNVLITASGRIKLCDLGFATPIPESALQGTHHTTAVGTAGYISPEVARGESDVRVGADIYSLGILLYALLTGHEPFAGASSEEVVTEQIENASPIPNLLKVPAIPEVIRFLKRMMHPDRQCRFGTVGDVIAALDRLLE